MTYFRTLYKVSDIVTYIKINRLKCAGHVIRMEEQSPTRRVLVAVVEGRRQMGRPKLRWEDGVKEDARNLGERNWRNAARNRDSWQELLKKALAQKGLLCQWWWLRTPSVCLRPLVSNVQCACALLSSVACSALQYFFFTFSCKLHDFRKKILVMEHKTRNLIFCTTFVWNVCHSNKNWARYNENFLCFVDRAYQYIYFTI